MANTVHLAPPSKPGGAPAPSVGGAPATAGTVDDRARRLVSERRFQEAAEVLLEDIRACGTPMANLDPFRRQRAVRASICLANAGEHARAERLLLDIGDLERAGALRARMQPQAGHGFSPSVPTAKGAAPATLPLVTPAAAQKPPVEQAVAAPAPADTRAPTEILAPEPSAVVPPLSTPESVEPERCELVPGGTINGRFRLDRSIGEGGMARVFQASDLVLGESIAIKFLVEEAGNETIVARFRAEVTLSRRLNHPNIIRLYDIGTFASWHFITMELLSGRDLAGELAAGVMPVERAIDLLLQACAGLQAVHDRGIIHRDIKPGNFFVTSDGILKVMDFGIAKRRDVPGVTSGGPGAGTPLYMSPEQFSDFSRVTPMADLYSLGCIAYEMFTGAPPFQHEEVLPLMVMHLNERPRSMRTHNPRLPKALDDVVRRLLEKNPSRRIQSCRELAERLGEIQHKL